MGKAFPLCQPRKWHLGGQEDRAAMSRALPRRQYQDIESDHVCWPCLESAVNLGFKALIFQLQEPKMSFVLLTNG